MPSSIAKIASRKFGSLLTGLSLLVVGASGVLCFFSVYSERLAGVHTIAGFAFLAAAGIHIAHNAVLWLRYTREQRRPSKSFVIALALTALLLGASLARARPLSALLSWGASLRKTTARGGVYRTIQLDLQGEGPLLRLDVKAGPFFEFREPSHGWRITPQMAAWTEDEEGHFLETLYVTRDEGRSGYDDGDDQHTLSSRPAALPVWAHRLGVREGSSPLLARHAVVPDVVTSASPLDNTYLEARAHTKRPGFFVLFEVNSSFDYNDFYRRDSYPDEPGYSDGGNPAQPSVVYRAWIDARTSRFVVMTPVGHGHHAGADGRIDPDLSHLTTALEIIDRIVVEVRTK